MNARRSSAGSLKHSMLGVASMQGAACSILIMTVLALPCPALAGPFEDAAEAYQRKDYATAAQLWRKLAEGGNADAQSNLGSLYRNGLGFPKDHAEALKWFRLAANQGSVYAQTSLGFMYRDAQALPMDLVQALMWFMLAADQGRGGSDYAAKRRDDLATKMTADQIAVARRLAHEWKPSK